MRMKEVTTAWDRAPTDAELNSFYGSAPDSFEVACAIERQTAAIDADDLNEICHEFQLEIIAAIMGKNSGALMSIFTSEIKKTIARRASVVVFGDVSVITANEVTL